MAEISQSVNIEMLEKLPDGTYKRKYPKTRADDGTTFDEHLAEDATEAKKGHIKLATANEVSEGVEGTKAVTPLRLKTELEKKISSSEKGSFFDLTTSISKSGYYTKTIPLSIDAKRGTLLIGSQFAQGIVHIGTSQGEAFSVYTNIKSSSMTSGYGGGERSGILLRHLNDNIDNDYIRLVNAYIEDKSIKLRFQNNHTSSSTIDVEVSWEVSS